VTDTPDAHASPDFATAQGWRHVSIATNGINLHAVEAGDSSGPLALFLHGFPEFWFAWKNHITPLVQAGFRVVALDQRGYNLSDRPPGVLSYTLDKLRADIIGALDTLGAEQAMLIAHDWGGHVAWSVAQKHPSRIRKLVILNVGHPVVMIRNILLNPRQLKKSWYAFALQIPLIPECLLRQNNFARLRKAMAWNGDRGPISEEDTRAYLQAWSRRGALSSMIAWYRSMPFSWPGWQKPRITVPTLVLWGMRDPFLDKRISEESIALCERGSIVYLDATHWVHHEQYAAVRDHIREFLASNP
jgi:pimeloyl-ACP methyl ester carboxylesterase